MTVDGYVAVQARVAELRSLVGARPAGRSSATGGAGFDAYLRSALAPTGAPSSSKGAAGTATGERVVELAKQHLGTPYVWGAEDPADGFDCSGLVQYVYKQLGVGLPRVSKDQARVGEPVASLADARPGDLVAFGSPVDHIGIYAGDGKMVVAPKRGDVVKVQDIYETPTAIRRVLGSSSSAGVPAAGAATPSSFDALFASAGAKHGVPANLLAAVAKAESGFDPRAVSRAGAQGLMQLMPSTAASLGVDAFDPAQAVDGAARLLRSHLDAFGSTELALAAYNAGPGAVRRHGGIPPYQETQTYVRRVLAAVQGGQPWN